MCANASTPVRSESAFELARTLEAYLVAWSSKSEGRLAWAGVEQLPPLSPFQPVAR